MGGLQKASEKDLARELGRRLAQVRLNRNISQEQLAAAAGISKRTLERAERTGSVQLLNFIRIFAALGLARRLELLLPNLFVNPMESLLPRRRRRKRAVRRLP